jgi:hypothetical protein
MAVGVAGKAADAAATVGDDAVEAAGVVPGKAVEVRVKVGVVLVKVGVVKAARVGAVCRPVRSFRLQVEGAKP